jgi:hypothetical protein
VRKGALSALRSETAPKNCAVGCDLPIFASPVMASYTIQPQAVYATPGVPVQGTMVAAPQQMAMGAVGAPSLGPRFQTSETECWCVL